MLEFFYIIMYTIKRCLIYPGVAKFGIALGSGPRGRGFKSRHSDHKEAIKKILPKKTPIVSGFSCIQLAVFQVTKP